MPRSKSFERLLEPGYIGSVKTRNRIIKTGAGMLMWHMDDLHMREEVKAYYEGIARGGVGLLIVESPVIDYPLGFRYRNRYRIDDDKYIKGLSELVDVIHKHKCPTFMMMNHDGPWQLHWGIEEPVYPGPPVAASPVYIKNPHDHHNEEPRPLSITEIEEIIDKFAKAAERASKAGFDGVDINASSSHLLHNFLSPFWNRREDIYGGSLENRARFTTEIIQEIKKRLGNDFPVSVIINGMEMGKVAGIEDGECLTIEDSRAIAVLLQEAGADTIQVRSHWIGYHVGGFLPDVFFYPEPPIPLESFPKQYYKKQKGVGANILLAEGIKKAVFVPVTVVGRLDPKLGEGVLAKGMADFIGMNRRLVADPELPNKISTGRIYDITPCTACDFCLGSRGRCRINGMFGTKYNTIRKADKKKKVLVIGGGPAGMEAARVSALRGHNVTLYEKSGNLGGLLPIAATVKGSHPEDIQSIIKYLKRQIINLDVKIRLGKEADLSVIQENKPDVVFLAAGGIPAEPGIPGIQRSNVIKGSELHRLLKIFLRFFKPGMLNRLSKLYMPIGKKVVIIGGAIQGCELAEFLTKRGRKVTIVEKSESMGEGMVMTMKEYLLMWFERKGVTLINSVREFMEITDKGLVIIDKEGAKQTFEADTIIPALPLLPNTELLKSLEGIAPEVYAIGDCKEPLYIADAIGTGLRTAMFV